MLVFGPPHCSLRGQCCFLLPAWLWSVIESVEEVGGRLQDVELNGSSARWWQCHSSSESCLHTGVLCCLAWRFLLPFLGQRELHRQGLLEMNPAGASGSGGSQGAFLFFSKVPLLLLGYRLCLSLSLPCS